jgi:cytochrome P450
MRYDSSVQFTSRIAVEDIEAGGHPIRCGDPVTLVIGAANRDPAVFEDPDRLDVGRDARAHLTFGHGMHYCLGGPLGLVETEVALAAIMSRVTGLRLTGAPLRWQDSINFRFLNGLPVTFVGR